MASTGSSSSVQGPETVATHADIVVALSSFNDARTIGGVARAVQDGLARYFGGSAWQIVLVDVGSTDGTREAARQALASATVIDLEQDTGTELGELPYHGRPRRASALRAILQTAQRLNAKACAVVHADLQTIEPEWVERLVSPVLGDRFDYVSPHYLRHVNEGAITKSIVYPMVRSLYGVRLRQPAAGEFACSGRLVTHYLDQDFWDVERASSGIDLWLATAAITGQFRSCEALLGPRPAGTRAPAVDLSSTLAQVVGALFVDLEQRVDVWQRARGSVAVPTVGEVAAASPESPRMNVDALMESFRLGYRELREVWTWVLPPRTIVELRKLTERGPEQFRFDDRLWATTIFDFALGYSLKVLPREHLLRSLTPLYTGWLASFVLEMNGASLEQVEERIERLCQAFEIEKRYLISRWRWPERMR